DPKNALIKPRLDALMRLSERAQASVRSTSMLRGAKLTELARTLHAVSPRAVLGRGYAAIRNEEGYLSRAAQLHPGDFVDIVMADGARAARIRGEEEHGEETHL
ncbi:MAG: exodeoxyribonuclease VII large subunit, partial [Christensenellales bacterium]